MPGRDSYSDKPIAWIGILPLRSGLFRNVRCRDRTESLSYSAPIRREETEHQSRSK